MSEPQLELSIPVLTDVIRATAGSPNAELEALLAELQLKLAARTFKLTDELLRSTFAALEATVFEQIRANCAASCRSSSTPRSASISTRRTG